MRKVKELKNKLFLTFLYLAVLMVLWYFKVPCLFKHFLRVECIGCGMSRAVLSAIRLDFESAFSFHPMFWSLPILYLYFLYDGKVIGKKIIDISVLLGILIGFLINWILKFV